MDKEQIRAQEEQYEKQLKPCPFCGGKARMNIGIAWYFVHCGNDSNSCKVDCCTFSVDSPEEAIEIWNKRGGEENG